MKGNGRLVALIKEITSICTVVIHTVDRPLLRLRSAGLLLLSTSVQVANLELGYNHPLFFSSLVNLESRNEFLFPHYSQ